MNVRFNARGNFRPLQASLAGLNRTMATTMATAGRATANVASPLDDLRVATDKGKLSAKQYGRSMRNMTSIIRESNAITNAHADVVRKASGASQVALDINRASAANMVTLGQRFAFTNQMVHAFGRNMINVGKNMQWAGRQVMVGLTLPLGLLAGAAAKTAFEYDEQVTKIIKVNNEAGAAAEESAEKFQIVEESIRRQADTLARFGAMYGQMATETNRIVAEFSQMGFIGNQLDALTQATTRFARVSGTDLESSMEMSRLAVQAFGTDLGDLEEQFARLNLVENNTALSMEELSDAIPVVSGVASTMGVTMGETAGLLAMMKENGIAAREGATALRTGLVRIVQEATDPAIEAFQTINMDLEAMQERMNAPIASGGGGGDVMFFFDELGEKLAELEGSGENAQAMVNDFVGAIGKLTGTRQSARFLTFLKEIPERTEEGTTAWRAWRAAVEDDEAVQDALKAYQFEIDMIQESAKGTADILRAEFNYELTKLGENFLDVANKATAFARNILRSFNRLSDGVQNTVFVIGGLIATLGPVTMLLGIMANAFGQILTIMTKFLPRMSIATVQEKALEEAYYKSTAAINAKTLALERMIYAQNQATGSTAAHVASEAAVPGGAAAGAAGATGGTYVDAQGRMRNAKGQFAPDTRSQKRRVFDRGAARGKAARGRAGTKIAQPFKAATAAIKRWSVQLAASLPILGRFKNFLGKMTGGIGRAGKGIGARMGMAGLGGKLVSGAGIAKGALAVGGAAGGGLAAVAAAIAAIPILADPKAFWNTFMSSMSGPLERLKGLWDTIMEQVNRIKALFQDSAGEGGGLSHMANIIGEIAGFLGGIILDSITHFIGLVVGVLGPAIEVVFNLVKAIGGVLSGDWSEAGGAIVEMFKAIGRMIANVIGSVMRAIGDLASRIPGIGDDIQRNMNNWANNVENIGFLQTQVNVATQKTLDLIKAIGDEQKDVAAEIEEGMEIFNGLVERNLIAVDDINALTEYQINNAEELTDEQRKQLNMLRTRIELQAELNVLEEEGNRIAELEKMQQEGKYMPRPGELFDRTTAAKERQEEIQERLNNLEFEYGDLAEDSADAQDDVTTATEGTNDALDENKKKQEEIEQKIRDSEAAAKAWASALKSSVGDVMNDIVAAVEAAMEAQQEKMNERFDKREDRIDTVADKELERIEDEVEAEEEQERKRKEWFERQKARLDYLENRRKGQFKIKESLARGDLEEAGLTRIELQAQDEQYLVDSMERQEDAAKEARDRQIEERKDQVEETRVAAKKQLKIERDAAQKAYEARKRSIELYLEDWKRITPATEREFRRHFGNLVGQLNGYGINMRNIATHYTEISGKRIVNGFINAIDAAKKAIAEDKKWENVGEATGAKFRRGLAKQLNKLKGDAEKITEGSGVSPTGGSGAVTSPRSSYIGPGGTSGMGLDSSTGGSTPFVPGEGYAGGTSGSGYTGGMMDYPSVLNRSAGNISLPRMPGIAQYHSGGNVSARPNMPGLKRDEETYVLQDGEYVIQRDAVRALGSDYLSRLNDMKRHSGGITDFTKTGIKEAGSLGPAAGMPFGLWGSRLAASAVEAGGGDPHIHKDYDHDIKGENFGKKVGKQIRDVMKEFLIFGPGREGAQGDGSGARGGEGSYGGGTWPQRRLRELSANTVAAMNFIRGTSWGGYVSPGYGLDRPDTGSDHAWGKAIDAMVAPGGTYADSSEKQVGWKIANWFVNNPGAFGTDYVIWQKLINSVDGRGWRDYPRYGPNPGPTLGHYDHPHISFLHGGGPVELRKGAKIKMDDTLASLHKGETVLTAPLTKHFEDAVKGMASGGNTYHLEFNIEGGNIDEKRLAKTVMREIDYAERSKGRKRVIRGN